jgi:pimeloyl-ACP methyl ester carboxylesterase
MKKTFRIAGIVIAALVAAYVVLALALIYWPVDIFNHRPPAPAVADGDYPHAERRFVMRDGTHLFARVFGAQTDTTIILVHGFGVDSSAYQRVASPWNQATGARIVLLDLRGHGRSEGKQGRVAYVGQYADDLSDVIGALRKESPGRIILAGHSMGGGVVLAYAQNAASAPVDAYLLVAPLLGSNAPTAPTTGGPAPMNASLYLRTPRLIGVLMISLMHIHIHAFDDLPIMYLNLTPPMSYGITAFASMGPRDYRMALAAINVPLLVIVGNKDEVFRGPAYAGVVKQYSHGRSVLVDGATHTSVLGDPASIGEIKAFINSLGTPELQRSP